MKTDSKDKRLKFVEWMSEETDFHSLRHPEITSLEATYTPGNIPNSPLCPLILSSPHLDSDHFFPLFGYNDDGKNNANFEQLTLNLKC